MTINIGVFCGSRMGRAPLWEKVATQLGVEIAQAGWGLVYGGGAIGLMGCVASSAMQAGGQVTGVIPSFLKKAEIVYAGLTDLITVDSLSERKDVMIAKSSAFVVLPGGIGTLDELYEVWTGNQLLGYQKPIILLNADGFYDGLIAFTKHLQEQNFLYEDCFEQIHLVHDVAEVMTILKRFLIKDH